MAYTAKRVLEIAARNGVTRGGLQAEVSLVDNSGEPVDTKAAIKAMRALLAILEDAEFHR